MTLADNIISTAWWDSLSAKEKSTVMNDRMTEFELSRNQYMKVSADNWWTGKNVAERSDIYGRFNGTMPQKKSRSYNKIKRGEKK